MTRLLALLPFAINILLSLVCVVRKGGQTTLIDSTTRHAEFNLFL